MTTPIKSPISNSLTFNTNNDASQKLEGSSPGSIKKKDGTELTIKHQSDKGHTDTLNRQYSIQNQPAVSINTTSTGKTNSPLIASSLEPGYDLSSTNPAKSPEYLQITDAVKATIFFSGS